MHQKLYNLELIHLMSGQDQAFVQKMVRLFLELMPGLLERLKKGIDEENYSEIKLTAHKMISSIEMVGIELIKPVVRSIEKMAADKNDIQEIKVTFDYMENIIQKVIQQIEEELTG